MLKGLSLNKSGSRIGTLSNPGGLASQPVLCLCPGKAFEDNPSLDPCTHVANPEEDQGPWLMIGSALADAFA